MNVTDGDRERARELADLAYQSGYDQQFTPSPRDITDEQVIDAIATALAEDRERARAPFLAALAGLEGEADLINPHTPGTPGYHGANGLKTGIAYAISKLRRAAEETTE